MLIFLVANSILAVNIYSINGQKKILHRKKKKMQKLVDGEAK